MEDIAPNLLKNLQADFEKRFQENDKVKGLYAKIRNETATYKEAHEFAIEAGEILSGVFRDNLSSAVLPDGKMYYNIAERILRPPLKNNYKLVSDVTVDVQNILNKEAGIGIKAIRPQINEDRVAGIIDIVSGKDNFDDIAYMLTGAVENFTLAVVDEAVRVNADFQNKSGLSPKIRRIATGKCCDWCSKLAGVYDYETVSGSGNAVFRRHKNCKCLVAFETRDGKIQNVHTKRRVDENEIEKIEKRKQIGLKKEIRAEDVTKQYFNGATPGKGKFLIDEGYVEGLHSDEIKTAELLHKTLGGDIVLLRESNADHEKTADYIWNEKLWDLKSTSTAKAANSAIRHGLQQIRGNPGGIILNYNKNEVIMEEVINVIERRMQWCNLEEVDIMIIADEKIKKILRYK